MGRHENGEKDMIVMVKYTGRQRDRQTKRYKRHTGRQVGKDKDVGKTDILVDMQTNRQRDTAKYQQK